MGSNFWFFTHHCPSEPCRYKFNFYFLYQRRIMGYCANEHLNNKFRERPTTEKKINENYPSAPPPKQVLNLRILGSKNSKYGYKKLHIYLDVLYMVLRSRFTPEFLKKHFYVSNISSSSACLKSLMNLFHQSILVMFFFL